jgi:DNA (cytosine-5)-methyltransferase 1
MKKQYNHVELFAGCGGMSLGLEAAGFNLLFANELSPMAAQTFAYNLLEEDLDKLARSKTMSNKVLWLKSKYEKWDLNNRLRENPHEFKFGKFSDLTEDLDLDKKLIVGDIKQLVDFFSKEASSSIVRDLTSKGIDLLSGGPPCQAFSMAGRRIRNDQKNQLPYWFAQMAGLLKPKFIILENVKGILNPFKEGGIDYYAHVEVAKAFSKNKYIPLCMLLNAKHFGIPQNRPRFVMIGIRSDIAEQIVESSILNEVTKKAVEISSSFYDKVVNSRVKELRKIGFQELTVFDVQNEFHKAYFNGELLPKMQLHRSKMVSTFEALDVLSDRPNGTALTEVRDSYGEKLNDIFGSKRYTAQVLENHQYRKHSEVVKARFRAYQILSSLNKVRLSASKLFFGNNEELLEEVYKNVKRFAFYFPDERLRQLKDINEFKKYVKILRTRKHSQRALVKDGPSPAQLTIPDDVCHYDSQHLRTLTVREIARLQSFPDHFVFKNKVTTGGNCRAFEVPQYTQVGNAVPPLMAFGIGNTLRNLLDKL